MSFGLCLAISCWDNASSCWSIEVSNTSASVGDFAQASETPKNVSISVSLTSSRVCAADMIWYCRVEKRPKLKQCICICPGGTDGWFPSVPEHVQQPVFWSNALLSAFPLAQLEVEKENHNNILACPSKWKGNLFSWKQATRPTDLMRQIHQGRYPSAQTLVRHWGPSYLLGDHKENLHGDVGNLYPQAYTKNLCNLREQTRQTPYSTDREKKFLSIENRYVRKIPWFLLG